MKTIFLKRIWSKVLLLCLVILSYGKSAQGNTISSWGYTIAPQPVSTDIPVAVMNVIMTTVIMPVLIVGLIIHGTGFYYRTTKKNINNNLKRLFEVGKISILFAISTYVVIYVIRFYKEKNISGNMNDTFVMIFIIIAVLALMVYLLLFIFLVKQIAYYFRSIKNKSKNDN